MAYEILMPRLGWNMEEGALVEWLKKDGDHVQQGEPVCTIEGDKATTEIESFESGILLIPPESPLPGDTVPVGTRLAYVVPENELDAFEAPEVADQGATDYITDVTQTATADDTGSPPPRRDPSVPAISPRARRIAGELGVDWRSLTGSGQSGRIVERDVRTVGQQPPPATDEAIPQEIEPTVQDETPVQDEPDLSEPAVEAEATPRHQEVPADRMHGVPMSALRRTIAERMTASAHTAVPVTLTTEVDVTALVGFRNRLIVELKEQAPAYHDILAKLVAIALNDYPELNSSLDGDTIIYHNRVNIGIATETDRGLFAPVVRDVGARSLVDIVMESSRLIEDTRNGVISLEHLNDGTFTITNLGIYDIDAFTPIINLPECAILGIGRIIPKVVVIDEASATTGIRKMMALSLTFDHRIVDGGPAARFLQWVKQLIEQPEVCYEA